MTQEELLRLAAFLEQTAETNEDTEFDSSQDYLVEELIRLVKEKGKTSIVEDFETPYVHPMITVQKWVEELKLLVAQTLGEQTAS
ncbi:hypothetical protein [Dyadobacter sp. Leaf189]|uniref:hypothetical protein n=1 Tax=Dyadobacter sp. Leaf189 TaxID=1736295 RepID=UPI0006F73D1A|nr:hypothetical protein [Dyadobacter sp. Leaf189]KQS26772.1 hypothetical protein ASG33_19655 [Dyadobacter sp. Leaf189]